MTRKVATAFAPGRANLIGEHTDYNGGLALPFAIELGVTVTASRTDQDVVADAGDWGYASIEPASAPGRRYCDWRDFVRGTVGELEAAGVAVGPVALEIRSDLPAGAGLSSSAALSVALALALLALAGEREPEPLWLASLCSRVENEWVGASTGLLDQLAILRGAPGCAVLLDFSELTAQRVPLELGDWRLAAVDSGQRRTLTTAGYGDRRAECERARELLGVPALSAASVADLQRLPAPLDRRARFVLEENARVREAVAALATGGLERVGELLDRSHEGLRDLFEVSTDAVEATVARCKQAGAAGARIIGGGFGGAVIALFPPGCEPPHGSLALRPAAAAAARAT